jgi:Uma2 family endonuclease
MPKVISEEYGTISIPAWVMDLPSFFRWIDTTDLPEKLPIRFLRGEVCVDLKMEEMFSHNLIKTELAIVLGTLIKGEKLGVYVSDGMLLANETAEFATEPDGMFLSRQTIAEERARFVAGKKRKAVATRILGVPDLVIEIVSPSSENDDTDALMSAYHTAGIPEYWLIDARGDGDIRFTIFKKTSSGYVRTRKHDGWCKSTVLDRFFRFTQSEGEFGIPEVALEVRAN